QLKLFYQIKILKNKIYIHNYIILFYLNDFWFTPTWSYKKKIYIYIYIYIYINNWWFRHIL
ncbi:MAG: hypothetical protein N7Q72_01835, partial [Spiroplasma sp. Tabriz.8]|nr:hypothetical protein [Spiroplasma sp. Tabriz.8]